MPLLSRKIEFLIFDEFFLTNPIWQFSGRDRPGFPSLAPLALPLAAPQFFLPLACAPRRTARVRAAPLGSRPGAPPLSTRRTPRRQRRSRPRYRHTGGKAAVCLSWRSARRAKERRAHTRRSVDRGKEKRRVQQASCFSSPLARNFQLNFNIAGAARPRPRAPLPSVLSLSAHPRPLVTLDSCSLGSRSSVRRCGSSIVRRSALFGPVRWITAIARWRCSRGCPRAGSRRRRACLKDGATARTCSGCWRRRSSAR